MARGPGRGRERSIVIAILNITYQGQSADYEVAIDCATSDAELRRIAVDVVRAGAVRGLHVPGLAPDAFASFVVDRLRGPNHEQRIFLRPKLAGGADRAGGP